MKTVLQILLAAFLHPIAVILMWIDIARRDDLGRMQSILWAIFGLVWGIGPIVYTLLGGGKLW